MKKPLWTKDEEIRFLKDISKGMDIVKISEKYNRSVNALELRLKKIIYDNIESGKKDSELARKIKLPEDKIKQYYYEYKGFIEKKKSKQENINVKSESIKNSEINMVNNDITDEKSQINNIGNVDNIKNKLESENLLLRELIENIKLKRYVHKLMQTNIIDDNIKSLIDKILE